jgi:hypothetical protein
MPNLWSVISNSGERLILQRGTERMEIERPEEPFAKELFMKRVAGSTVSDIGVDLFMRPKKLPMNEEENNPSATAHSA